MSLSQKQKDLIVAIANNKMENIKPLALQCLYEDTTTKNKSFCKHYINTLETNGGNLIALPPDLSGLLCMEDVSNSFNENRYYLSNSMDAIYHELFMMKQVNEKLLDLGIPYPNSMLLHGKPGTGKTTFGRYVAHKLGMPFCYLNFSNLVDSYMGSTSKNINKAFSFVSANPCVFMLDEIDCISIRRGTTNGSGGTSGEMARITISLMQEFDKLPNNILVLGATNRFDRLDEALVRRFSSVHEIEYLTEKEKEELITQFTNDVGYKLGNEDIKELITYTSQDAVVKGIVRKISLEIAKELGV